jgi:hypothetical protein
MNQNPKGTILISLLKNPATLSLKVYCKKTYENIVTFWFWERKFSQNACIQDIRKITVDAVNAKRVNSSVSSTEWHL